MAKIIDGKKISQEIKDELKVKVAELNSKGVEVSLAVILVGNDPASTGSGKVCDKQEFVKGENNERTYNEISTISI